MPDEEIRRQRLNSKAVRVIMKRKTFQNYKQLNNLANIDAIANSNGAAIKTMRQLESERVTPLKFRILAK